MTEKEDLISQSTQASEDQSNDAQRLEELLSNVAPVAIAGSDNTLIDTITSKAENFIIQSREHERSMDEQRHRHKLELIQFESSATEKMQNRASSLALWIGGTISAVLVGFILIFLFVFDRVDTMEPLVINLIFFVLGVFTGFSVSGYLKRSSK